MHDPLVADQWSRRGSWLHRRDARAKLAVLLVVLIAVSSTPAPAKFYAGPFLAYGALLWVGSMIARLPIGRLALRALWVLPFSLTLAGLTYWSGEPARATILLVKSYLSAYASLLFVATTPVEQWTMALEQWHAPQSLILVMQFLHRYLFLIVDQAQRMLRAASLRSGVKSSKGQASFEVASAMVGVLFARSWQRAEGIHQAMLARGFQGHFPAAEGARFRTPDAALLGVGLTASLAARFLLA